MRVSGANAGASEARANKGATSSAPRELDQSRSPAKASKAIAIDGHDSGGKGSAKSKSRKKSVKPAFQAPSVEMVHQAFNMLDPHGSGQVNPAALYQVSMSIQENHSPARLKDLKHTPEMHY